MLKRSALVGLAILASLTQAQSTDLQKEKAKMASLTKGYHAAKAAYLKQPHNATAKKRYVANTVALATATMMTPTLGPKQKYPGALQLYREALKADPNNKEARDNSKMIEDIYRSMGRPIPK